MRSRKKDKKVLVAVIVSVICITALAGGAIVYAQQSAKDKVLKESDGLMSEQNTWSAALDSPYKEKQYVGEDIKKQVCEKYNLDYETVKEKEITGEISDYETALHLLANNGKEDMAYLGFDFSEIFAFSSDDANAIIKEVCEKAGLSYDTAKISDLSAEQLMEIQKRCFETSDHDDYRLNQLVPEKVKKQVCEKYNLDYSTVRNAEITGEAKLYQSALMAQQDKKLTMEELTLSLVTDSVQYPDVKAAVEAVCGEGGLSYTTSKVADLSEDQMMAIFKKIEERTENISK